MNSVSVTVERPEVKSRPIIFHARSIRAILAGAKTMTRRVVMPQPMGPGPSHWYYDEPGRWWTCGNNRGQTWRCPYGSPGDRLWVRETWLPRAKGSAVVFQAALDSVEAAGIGGMYGGWRSPLHLPKKLSRIALEIISLGVERLQDISAEDAIAEGADTNPANYEFKVDGKPAKGEFVSPQYAFSVHWNSTNGRRKGCAWKDNPWIWVVSFVRMEKIA